MLSNPGANQLKSVEWMQVRICEAVQILMFIRWLNLVEYENAHLG
jgi:hypothetical protein